MGATTSRGYPYPFTTDTYAIPEDIQALAEAINNDVAGFQPASFRVATQVETSDSSNFTGTEVTVESVSGSLVTGKIYRVHFAARWASTVANDRVQVLLREDSVSGTQLQLMQFVITDTGSAGAYTVVEAEFTAVATASKTFVATAQRIGGTGSCRRSSSASAPAYLYIDYVRG